MAHYALPAIARHARNANRVAPLRGAQAPPNSVHRHPARPAVPAATPCSYGGGCPRCERAARMQDMIEKPTASPTKPWPPHGARRAWRNTTVRPRRRRPVHTQPLGQSDDHRRPTYSIDHRGPCRLPPGPPHSRGGGVPGIPGRDIDPARYQVTIGVPNAQDWVISQVDGDRFTPIAQFGAARDDAFAAVALMRGHRVRRQSWLGPASSPRMVVFTA